MFDQEWPRRKARLESALEHAPNYSRRCKLDVSTAPLDVVHYPYSVLNFDWKRVVTRCEHAPINIDELPREVRPTNPTLSQAAAPPQLKESCSFDGEKIDDFMYQLYESVNRIWYIQLIRFLVQAQIRCCSL